MAEKREGVIVVRGVKGLSALRKLLDVPIEAWNLEMLRMTLGTMIAIIRAAGDLDEAHRVGATNLALAAARDLGDRIAALTPVRSPEPWQETLKDMIDDRWLVTELADTQALERGRDN